MPSQSYRLEAIFQRERQVSTRGEKQNSRRDLSFIRGSGFKWDNQSSKVIYCNETRQRRTSNDERAKIPLASVSLLVYLYRETRLPCFNSKPAYFTFILAAPLPNEHAGNAYTTFILPTWNMNLFGRTGDPFPTPSAPSSSRSNASIQGSGSRLKALIILGVQISYFQIFFELALTNLKNFFLTLILNYIKLYNFYTIL